MLQVNSVNPNTTSFIQKPVRPLITRSDLSITDISNSLPDTLSIELPIFVLADEDVHDSDIIKFTLTLRHTTYHGEESSQAEVKFTVTEPHLTAQISLNHDESYTFEKDDVIAIQYTIRHSPRSVTPAYKVQLLSDSALFSDVSNDVITTELAIGEVESGVVELVLQELPVFGADLDVAMVLEFTSAPNEKRGRVYRDKISPGVITASVVSGWLSSCFFSSVSSYLSQY